MPAKPRKEWTLLVFMAGDNNLDREGERDLEQIKSVDVGDHAYVAVQFDRAEAGRRTRRYLLRHGSSLVSDVVDFFDETNTGDPAVLEDFLLWGIREFPSKHLMVVIWNHGGGVDDTDHFATDAPQGLRRGLRSAVVPPRRRALFASGGRRKIAVDDEARDFLDNRELKKVLTTVSQRLGRPIDILGMDACLMSMVEVAWQIRGTVDLMVGSQDNEPGHGWPYDAILRELAADPSMTPKQLAAKLVSCYLADHTPDDAVTQSACEVGKLSPLFAAVDRLAGALLAGWGGRNFELAVIEARGEVLQFAFLDYVDLHHLCEVLAARLPGDVRSACKEVQAALAKVVFANGSRSAALANASGLSIYFPRISRAETYAKLDFATGCRWAEFLKKITPEEHHA